jgi:uncharacterized protein involved in type VI secretion and phage assembly
MSAGKELGLAIAVVSKRDDPDGLGRVKVKFPTLDNRESDWSPVVTPFGGAEPKSHGFFWVPEVGDTVVAGFDQGDPKSVIVLGSVYSKSRKPPVTDKDTRILQTTKNHFIKIVEDPGRITIETAAGQRVDIDDQGKTITIEATETVTVNGAKKVNVNASESVTIKGATGVTVDGGSSVTVKAQRVTVDATSIALGGAGASNPAVLGRDFVTLFATHTHVSNGTPPVQAAQAATVLSKKTMLSG